LLLRNDSAQAIDASLSCIHMRPTCLAGQGTVIVSDINAAMLEEGKKRASQLGGSRSRSTTSNAAPRAGLGQSASHDY
jgi:hypothetical protein